MNRTAIFWMVGISALLVLSGATCPDVPPVNIGGTTLPSHADLTAALEAVVAVGDSSVNGGLANEMWATLVDRDGVVRVVTFSGDDRGDQWPGSRVIFSTEGKHGKCVQPSGPGPVNREPVLTGPTWWKPVRIAG